MKMIRDDIQLLQFAKKNVITLPMESSIGESIRLMYRNLIRHIPIMYNGQVQGVVNPDCIMDLISEDPYEIDFNDNVGTIMTDNYYVVAPDFPLFEAVELISRDPTTVFLIEAHQSLIGIYTEIDVLDTDFLWLHITDHAVSSDEQIGTPILLDGSSSADNSIHNSLKLMKALEQNYIMLTDGQNEVRGIVDFFEIMHHIYYTTYRQGHRLGDVLNQSMYSIFPSSGAWYVEPVLLSMIRREMYINDIYYAIILDDDNQPKRVVSSRDIIAYLVENSDYFPFEP